MIPLRKKRFNKTIYPPIKDLILGSVKNSYPEIFEKIVVGSQTGEKNDLTDTRGFLDAIPYLIKLAYWIKRKNSQRFADVFKKILQNNIFYSDFIIRYPMKKRYNKNILNMHRERWENPAGKPGLHYESIINLTALTCDRTIEFWEQIESSIYGRENRKVLHEFDINSYTGDAVLSYHDMKYKRPIRLSR